MLHASMALFCYLQCISELIPVWLQFLSHNFSLLWDSPCPAHLFWVSFLVTMRASGQPHHSQTSLLLSPHPKVMVLTAQCFDPLSP